MNGAPLQRKVMLVNPNGLHMRPSAAFVQLAGKFQSNVTVTYDGKSVNGKSLWDLLLLAALPGSELLLEAGDHVVDGEGQGVVRLGEPAVLAAPPGPGLHGLFERPRQARPHRAGPPPTGRWTPVTVVL